MHLESKWTIDLHQFLFIQKRKSFLKGIADHFLFILDSLFAKLTPVIEIKFIEYFFMSTETIYSLILFIKFESCLIYTSFFQFIFTTLFDLFDILNGL